MPCLARKASSVLTSTSNSALPMPRTSYFTSAIHLDPVAGLRLPGKSASCRPEIWPAAYHDPAFAGKPRYYARAMIRSFLTVSTGTLASRLLGFARDSMKGACSGCPSSTATLQHGIQNLLKHFVPDVVEVRPV